MELRDEIRRKASLVAFRTMERNKSNADMEYDIWDWQGGVGLYGLYRYYQKTKDETVFAWLKEYADYHIAKGLGEKTINTTGPVNLLLDLYLDGEKKYEPIIREYVDFCRSEAERTDDGVLVHSVIGKSFTHQIWSDTLFMGVLLLCRWASLTGDKSLMADTVHQMIEHNNKLLDPETGIFFHGYDESNDGHMSAVRWGRANGWALITAPEMLILLPEDIEGRNEIISNYRKHLDAVLSYMGKDGKFTTVLNNPETPEEITISSCVCYSIYLGRKLGLLDEKYEKCLEIALENILSNVAEDGSVLQCSGGTPIMPSEKAYAEIPNVVSYYGQGLALLALSSLL